MPKKNTGYSHWNYRVIFQERGEGFYTIREVYYEKGKPVAVTKEPCYPLGTNPEELEHDFKLMAMAFKMPILKYEDF